MFGKLEKISDNDNALRTNDIEGNFAILPQVGKRFVIIGEPLEAGYGVRVVSTSPVQEINIEGNGAIVFRTLNSIYRLIGQKEITNDN